MKIVITGGHFSPAYSLITHLRGKADMVIVGRKSSFESDTGDSFEYTVAQREQIPFYALTTGRLQRKFSIQTIPSLFKFPVGIQQAVRILKKEKPDVVLSFGGYLALPVAIAAKIVGIPVVIHEQTQHAGLANKVIGRFADKILVSFKSSTAYFPKSKVVITGNPVRQDIFTPKKPFSVPQGKKIIYITGGSSGSHMINMAINTIIPVLVREYVVIHQTGNTTLHNDYDVLIATRDSLDTESKENYIVKKFVLPEEIGWVLQHASLIISRAGINIVSELIALKKPSLLIPLAHGQNNEQLSNAQLINRIGLGEYLTQNMINPDVLLSTIETMMGNLGKYVGTKDCAHYYIPNAIQNIADQIQSIYEEKNKKK